MNIKSLLIGSAAALAAVSGAQAADAIVAAQPEPMEYVRVCDAFGTGFFYIPGSETCLKFDGFVRFQTDFGRDKAGTADWNTFTHGQFNIDTRTDTELGFLRGYIGLQGNTSNVSREGKILLEQAFIELGGLKVGKFYSWWDDGIVGETDSLSSNSLFNSVRYTYDGGALSVGVSAEELQNAVYRKPISVTNGNNVGIAAMVGAKVGGVKATVIGGYDIEAENGSVRAIVSAAGIGPETLEIASVWASGNNAYFAQSEWSVAAGYAIKATNKLTITPGVQYFDKLDVNDSGDFFGNRKKWVAGFEVDYKIVPGMNTKVSVQYANEDQKQDQVFGFVNLQRSF